MGVLLMFGFEMFRLCNDLRVFFFVDVEGINEDIVIVDWLVEIRGFFD